MSGRGRRVWWTLAGLAVVLAAASAAVGQEDGRAVEQALRAGERELVEAGRQARAGQTERAHALAGSAADRFAWALERADRLPAERRQREVANARYNLACAAALRGEVRVGLSALELALDAGWSSWDHLEEDADLDPLRADPTFAAVVRRAQVREAAESLRALAVLADHAVRQARQGELTLLEPLLAGEQQVLAMADAFYTSPLSRLTLRARIQWQVVATAHALGGRRAAALDALEAALETGLLAPDQVAADSDLASLRGEERFRRALADARRRWAARPREAAALELDLTWTFEDDLRPSDFAAQAEVARGWARALWAASEGNVRVRSVRLVDRAQHLGELHTPRGTLGRRMLDDQVYAMNALGVIHVPGRCGAFTLVHEMGHLLFWLPEEYDTPGGCPCVQAGELGRLAWCDDGTHSVEQAALGRPSCWARILERRPQARHPGPGGELPPVEVRVEDA